MGAVGDGRWGDDAEVDHCRRPCAGVDRLGTRLRRRPEDEDLAGAVLSIQARSFGENPGRPGAGAGTTIAVERLDLPEPLQRVDRRAAALDARVDGHAGAPRRELDGLEQRHRTAELAALHRRLEANSSGTTRR